MLCLFLVYISWGSTFINIKYALQSWPPFLLCGTRMTCAGLLLYAFTWLRGERVRPTGTDLRQALVFSVFLVLLSSGLLSKGQETVPSGTAAIFTGTTPLWMVLGGWLVLKEPRPSRLQALGLLVGSAGVAALGILQGVSGATSFLGLFLLLLSVLAWVAGSFYSKRHGEETRLSVMRTSGLFMLLGGVEALLVGALLGERLHVAAISPVSLAAMAALIILGAAVAYTCYFWLLLHARTAVAISYEYVNPVIGVFLGWLLGGEQVDGTVVLTCCALVGSVFLVIADKHN